MSIVQQVVAVYDSKAEAFMNPMYFQAVGQAVRSFADAVNGKDNEFARHPEDYTLFHLGAFYALEGRFEQFDAHKSLANGVALKEVSE